MGVVFWCGSGAFAAMERAQTIAIAPRAGLLQQSRNQGHTLSFAMLNPRFSIGRLFRITEHIKIHQPHGVRAP